MIESFICYQPIVRNTRNIRLRPARCVRDVAPKLLINALRRCGMERIRSIASSIGIPTVIICPAFHRFIGPSDSSSIPTAKLDWINNVDNNTINSTKMVLKSNSTWDTFIWIVRIHITKLVTKLIRPLVMNIQESNRFLLFQHRIVLIKWLKPYDNVNNFGNSFIYLFSCN